ncbi:MAG: PCMD domain-containing protein [Dysgonamonadaceae bacterium]|jgi:hypothetical protein|nr:PCMD domain-containing protein [Dysgonamonadaceae bacterium]
MIKQLPLLLAILFFSSCIKDEAPNPEADIVAISFTENSLRTKSIDIYNDYIVLYPKRSVQLQASDIVSIELSEGASYRARNHATPGDTLFFIDVTSQSKEYTKTYSVIQVNDFPLNFGFETWVRPSSGFLYENPKEGPLQWYSSNNGVAIAWNSSSKKADEYPVRPKHIAGNTAVELRTMTGPGEIAGGVTYIPCLAGSLYLGGFSPLMGLIDPLKATLFGVPFNSGKPVKLTGFYIYKEGVEDYINGNGDRDATKKDKCSIYAVLFKTGDNVEFLYGDNIDDSPNIIARAEVPPENIRQETDFVYFEAGFDYLSYAVPFAWNELDNNEYKLTIVFASSYRGGYYEGRPGNTLIIDNVQLIYETNDE